MRSSRLILLLLLIGILLIGCDARKNLVGKWQVVSLNVKKNAVFNLSTKLVFDKEGYIMFNEGKAARGQWELTTSNSTLSLFLYGKSLQHDVKIIGIYKFSSNKLTITEPKNEGKVLLELEKLDEEQPQ